MPYPEAAFQLLRKCQAPIVFFDKTGSIVFCSDAFAKLLNINNPVELTYVPLAELCERFDTIEIADHAFQTFKRVLFSDVKESEYQQREFHYGGKLRLFTIQLTPVFDDAGNLEGVLIFFHDTTEYAPHEAEDVARVMFDTVPMLCSFWDRHGNMLHCNREALRLLELKKPSDYTEHFFDLNPEYQPDGKPTVETAKEYIAAAFETGYQRFEWMYKTATGKPLPVETTLVRVPWKGGYRLAAYSRDLRETKAKEQEIKETDERNRQLEIEKKAALRATQLRNEFLVNLSHEFLTPLNAIQGFTLCTLQTALTGQQRDWLGQVADATKTLSQVINNVLEISHLESGKCQLAHDRFFLHGIITKLKQSTAALIKNTLLTARITCQPDVPDELVGDADRLEYILLSLVSNAVRFTPSGSISVNVQKCSDKLPDGTTVLPEDNTVVLLFSVQDTGIGMSAEVMDSLFYPFMQADTSARRTHSGTGVGLAICKNIIELMHGKIWCQSTPNVGSTFYFTVRLRCA